MGDDGEQHALIIPPNQAKANRQRVRDQKMINTRGIPPAVSQALDNLSRIMQTSVRLTEITGAIEGVVALVVPGRNEAWLTISPVVDMAVVLTRSDYPLVQLSAMSLLARYRLSSSFLRFALN
jgi:hypothetical protein